MKQTYGQGRRMFKDKAMNGFSGGHHNGKRKGSLLFSKHEAGFNVAWQMNSNSIVRKVIIKREFQ